MINDTMDYKVNIEAMNSVGFSTEEKTTIWKIVAAILHLVSFLFLRDVVGNDREKCSHFFYFRVM